MKKLHIAVLPLIFGFALAAGSPPVMKLETVDITLNINQQFTCAQPSLGVYFSTIRCTYDDPDTAALLEVTVQRPRGSSKVSRVTAALYGGNRAAATWFLPYLASAPIEGGFPAKAKSWTEQTWNSVKPGKPKSILLGSTKYELLSAGPANVILNFQHKDYSAWAAKN
jgi:hypothetical protein